MVDVGAWCDRSTEAGAQRLWDAGQVTFAASDVSIRPFDPVDEDAVVALWDEAGLLRPWNDPRSDIARKLTVQPELFVVAVEADDAIVGAVMAGFDGHRGWINYLATAVTHRGRGIGAALVEHVVGALADRGCPKVNLQVRADNDAVIAFYERLGFGVEELVNMGRRLIVDDPAARAAERA
jgi:ribosomal protein S18 acetylase RimI-like enzyme